jgi:hemolysin D
MTGIIWAVFGEVNIVASAEGKILPGSRVKVVQPLEKGVVKEGESVNQGQPLLELDSTLTGTDESRLKKALFSAEMKLAVIETLLKRVNSEGDTTQDWSVNIRDDKTAPSHFNKLLQERWLQIEARESTLISAKEAADGEYQWR